MSAGDGYRYLLASVAAGDGHPPLIRYYTKKGTPPAYWLGTGTTGLGTGSAWSCSSMPTTRFGLDAELVDVPSAARWVTTGLRL
jgi:hypothetical protein